MLKGEQNTYLSNNALLKTQASISTYNPIKKLKLKTFSNLAATKKVKVQGKEVMRRADKELLGRIAIIVFDNDASKHTRRIKQSIKNDKIKFYKEQLENIKR